MPAWLSDPLAQRLTGALLHFLWQGAVLAAVLAVTLRLCRTPGLRYTLSLATLGLMGLCLPLTAWQLSPRVSHPAAPVAVSQPAVEPEAGSASLELLPPPAPAAEVDLTVYQPYVLVLWSLGVIFLALRLVLAWVQSLWMRGRQTPLPTTVETRALNLIRGLGMVRVRIRGSARVTEAMAVGLVRPVVLLPLSWMAELPPDVLDAVIAHELAHLRRYDLWAMLGQRVLETVLFYHPAVWWVSRRISLEREMCCDELAVRATGERLVYARALEAVGRRMVREGKLTLVAPVSGESGMNLLTRVRSVLGLRAERDGAAWPAGLLIACLMLCLAFWSLSVAGADDNDRDRQAVVDREEDDDAPLPTEEEEDRGDEERDEEDGDDEDDEDEDDNEDRPGKKEKDEEEDDDRPAKKDADRDDDDDDDRPGKKRDVEDEFAPKVKVVEKKVPEKDHTKRKVYLKDYQPETEREKILLALIQQLEEEVAVLRKEVSVLRDDKHAALVKEKMAHAEAIVQKQMAEEALLAKKKAINEEERAAIAKKKALYKEKVAEEQAVQDKLPGKKIKAKEGDRPVKKGPPDGEVVKKRPIKEKAPTKKDAPRKDPDEGEDESEETPEDERPADEEALKKF